MIQSLLIQALLTALFRFLDGAKIKAFVSSLLQKAQQHVKNTPAKADDLLLAPMHYLAQVLSLPNDRVAAEFAVGGHGLQMVFKLVDALFAELGTDAGKHFADWLFDKIELLVHRSKSTIDDKIVLPLIEFLRKTFDIPDYPDAETPNPR